MNELLTALGVVFLISISILATFVILFSQYIFDDKENEFLFKVTSLIGLIVITYLFAFNVGTKYEATETKETVQSSPIQRKTEDSDSLLESTIRSNKIQEESSRNRQK